MLFRQLFDHASSTYTYLLADDESREAALIDPVRDQIERDIRLLQELGLKLVYTLETHVHADHVTSSGPLRKRLGSRSVVSHRAGAGCADVLVREGDEIRFGKSALRVLETPGHTDGCLSYHDPEGGRVFTGDTLLIRGCGRTDFQQGDSHELYRSITEKLFTLAGTTLVYPGHDYRGRTASSIDEERCFNPRLANKSEAQFVDLMARLDLAAPKKIAEAVPANLACGKLQVVAERDTENTAWAPVVRSNVDVPEVTVHWLQGNPGAARIVDVREPDEYDGNLGHIEGSELVPLDNVARAAASWAPAEPLVIVCRSGRRSGIAALDLEKRGFSKVASLAGGMADWNQAGFPVSRTKSAS